MGECEVMVEGGEAGVGGEQARDIVRADRGSGGGGDCEEEEKEL